MCVGGVDSNRNVNVNVNVDRGGDVSRSCGRSGNPSFDPYGPDRVETRRANTCGGGDFEDALAKAGSAMKESIDDPLKQGSKIAEAVGGVAKGLMDAIGGILKGLLGGLLGGGGGGMLGGLLGGL